MGNPDQLARQYIQEDEKQTIYIAGSTIHATTTTTTTTTNTNKNKTKQKKKKQQKTKKRKENCSPITGNVPHSSYIRI